MDVDGAGLGSETKPDGVEVAAAHEIDTIGVSVAGNNESLSDDETNRLRNLAAEVVDQDELERNIGRQVSMSSILLNYADSNRLTFALLGRPFAHWTSE